ncbi:hypothetical protein [Compostibacter hankyongensis]|uniref:Acetylxylan esterase n=1 Tax=Compostibacter hankyongensis TaxID=1007089 RepID=A0ABP8FMB3_9BACT
MMITATASLNAQPEGANYDESKVPEYILPALLVGNDGSAVSGRQQWERRRKEIYDLFEREVYGAVPAWRGKITATEISHRQDALGGLALRREIRLRMQNGDKSRDVFLLLYLPRSRKAAPVFLGYNFSGNHTVTAEKDVHISPSWVANNKELGITDNRATEASRGSRASAWPLQDILSRGYGVATLYYGDVDPDFDDGFKNGVHALFDQPRDSASWGSIATWAWGLSRVMDYLEKDPAVNAKEVFVIGHSRLGKTALWAGASDRRFAMVISNESGCGGAAISRRKFGETVSRINTSFPHWFCDNFKKYNDKEETLPVDQHELIALIAPRPVYVASASEDLWSDPRGEFLGAKNAEPAYRLFGLRGLKTDEMPAPEHPVGDFIGYHLRTGKHDITRYDWTQYLNFADRHFPGSAARPGR